MRGEGEGKGLGGVATGNGEGMVRKGGEFIATVKVAIKENKENKVLKKNNEEFSFAKTCRGGEG